MKSCTVLLLFMFLLSCCSTADWVRRNTIHKRFYMDHEKEAQDLAKQIENRPTTKVKLSNNSAIISRIILRYKDVVGVDPYSVDKLVYKNFILEYEVLPHETVEIVMPINKDVKVTIFNNILNKKRDQTINTGGMLFGQIVDATPPYAMTNRQSGKTCNLDFRNESGYIGEVTVSNPGGFSEYEIDLQRSETEREVRIRREILTLPENTVFQTSLMPLDFISTKLKDGIYWISISGHKFKNRLFIQVSDGRLYDKNGKKLFNLFEIPRQPGDPNPNEIPVNVPNKQEGN